jgi:phosphopantothenoylcysteine decarboxylase/phosphopantothenate--cysteine ligase
MKKIIDFNSKKILITAGPTREAIDDVRYISNHSTGKMGFAIAEAANELGADVTLICGPVNIECSNNIKRINVVSAEEMYDESIKHFPNIDIAILSAAVSDFKPINYFQGKIKKEQVGENPIIELTKTKDILYELGSRKNSKQFLVGFALESENLIDNGKQKLSKKNCDLIVANHANKPMSGFGGDFNTITIIGKDDYIKEYLPMSKSECAYVILQEILLKL